MTERVASVSLDLDNLWTYLKIHGDDWEGRPSYLDTFVPYFLDVCDEIRLRPTVFVIGVDADQPGNHEFLRALVESGHEIGNHSYEHEPWLQLYSDAELTTEISKAHDAIVAATGEIPRGFRGPGFSWSPALLPILRRLGYCYDASTLPTFLGPLARIYYFWTSELTEEEKEQRKELFGRFSDGFRPVKPYLWDLSSDGDLLEIPVTTMPVFKTPFHFSYLVYLARVSETLMMLYLKVALAACRATNTEPSFLLHPLDIIGGDQIPQLKFFPGMDVASHEKRRLLVKVLDEMAKHFKLVPMQEHADLILERGSLKQIVAT